MSKYKNSNLQLNKVEQVQEPEVLTIDEPIEPVIVQMEEVVEVVEEPIVERVEREPAPEKYHITSHRLNMRRGPAKTYDVLKTLSTVDTVEVYEISGEWARIKHNSDEGWIMLQYAEKI